MALSSWNALYTHIEQKFMRKRQWRQLHLLKVFVQHADPFGLSYPGEDLIKELTGIGTTAQVNENMQFLTDGEYLKVWETWNPRRRVWDYDYQVSPRVMYIREEYQGYCEKLWITGERDYEYENAVVIKLNGQPASEPESEPTSVTSNTTHHHHPSNISAKRKGQQVGPGDDYETETAEPPKQRRRRKTTGTGRAIEKDPQAVAPAKLDGRKYRSPLPRPDDEDQAQDLHTMLRLRIHQARGLVANYEPAVIDAAKRATMHAMEKGTVIDPPALFSYLVKKAAVSPDDRKLYPTWNEKIAAANADDNAYD